MTDWCIRHKCAAVECADRHRTEELARQLAAADAIILGYAKQIAAEYNEAETLAEKIDALGRELTIAQAQNAHLRKVAALPIIFYDLGPVTDKMREHWLEATNSEEMTTKVMCDAIRRVLGESN
jgi:G3E family GTPase